MTEDDVKLLEEAIQTLESISTLNYSKREKEYHSSRISELYHLLEKIEQLVD